MTDINDITKALAGKYAGIDLRPTPAPASAPAAREYSTGYSSPVAPRDPKAPKVFPGDRMMLGGRKGQGPIPNRPMVMISSFSDQELEEMFATPARRGWDFETWLEVVGLPRDLDEKHDAAIYPYAVRAFLNRKREAHSK